MEETIDSTGSQGLLVTEKMKSDLRGASPWMKFVGIVLIIFAALGALGTLIALIGVFHYSILLMLVLQVLYIYMATLIFKMGNKYSNFIENSSANGLEMAFDAQKKFWMIFGILIIAGFVIGIASYGYIQSVMADMPQ